MINYKNLFAAGAFLLASVGATAQDRIRNWNDIGEKDIVTKDSITKKGYTLLFITKVPAFDPGVKERMIDAFFAVYPKQAKLYNKKTARKVIFLIDPAYKGVAATSGTIVRYNPDWFVKNPEDIDVVTHEVMHITQSYGYAAGAGWLTEGIADYVRYKLGVNNVGAKWTMPDYKPSQSYNNAYRITARFLVWAEKAHDKKLVKKLDAALRNKTYTGNTWKELTGKTVAELWDEYSQNPSVALSYR